MSPGDGAPPGPAEKSRGDVVQDVSQKSSRLVREEIELAKAEVTQKVSKLGKGAGVGAAAGVFLIFALVMFLHALAWFFNDLLNVGEGMWLGFLIVFGILLLLAAIAGFLAYRWLKGGAPPTPDMAIEQAKLTRAELEGQKVQRDQVSRSLERGEEVRS